jgi:hypothetical protein
METVALSNQAGVELSEHHADVQIASHEVENAFDPTFGSIDVKAPMPEIDL